MLSNFTQKDKRKAGYSKAKNFVIKESTHMVQLNNCWSVQSSCEQATDCHDGRQRSEWIGTIIKKTFLVKDTI